MSIVNLQSDPIMCRSPYLIEVNQTFPANVGSKVELFLWNYGDTPPTSPTYVLSKLIPAPSQLQMIYNISEYIKEYITWTGNEPIDTATPTPTLPNEWAYCKVIRYAEAPSNTFTAIDTKTYICFDGYGYYEDSTNPEYGKFGLPEGTYEYYYNPDVTGINKPNLSRYGNLRCMPNLNDYVVYTNLADGTTSTFTFSTGIINTDAVQQFFNVFPTNDQDGNLVEYYSASNTLQGSWTFKPIQECKYTPVVCDFVNQLGMWQRTIFFKVSKTKIKTQKKEYNLYKANNVLDYDTRIEQRKVFQANAKESIEVNTDWVEESYNDLILKPLMLSEVIRINNKPATIKTSSTELFEHINKKLINYKLEFEYAYWTINNVT